MRPATVVPTRPARSPDPIARACFTSFLSAAGKHPAGVNPAEIAISRCPDDASVLRLVTATRAAVGPAATTSAPWANVLAPALVGSFYSSLPSSAASRLIAAGLRVNLAAAATIAIPRRASPASAADLAWTGEGSTIAVPTFSVEAATLGPGKKVAVILAASLELAESSGGEQIFTAMLRESAAASLEGSMFSTAAATPLRPAGLLADATVVTPATAGADAALTDVGGLLAAVAGSGGDPGATVVVAAARQAAHLIVRAGQIGATVWPSLALPDGLVIAVDASVFLSGFSGEPVITTSADGAVHLEDTNALPIVALGPVVAAPVTSAFQAGLLLTRLITRAAWVMRRPGAVAFISDANWG